MAITSSTTSSDQEKFLAAKLISRLRLRLVASSLCTKISQPKGTGATAYFVRYNRMNVPLATLTEGSDPSASSFTLTQFSVTLDQWGDIIEITDVAELTTKHPLMKQAMELLAENAQRVIDREVQVVWLANTNVQYASAAYVARSEIQTTDKLSDAMLHRALVTLKDAGVAPRGQAMGGNMVDVEAAKGTMNGGLAYVAVCGPQVLHDILSASSGTFVTIAQYSNAKALYNCEVGTWLGVRFVETNFIPKFTLLGTSTEAVASGGSGGITGLVITAVNGGGSLNSGNTYFWKVTRKDKLRGFEEAISVAHSTAADATGGNDDSFTIALPSTAGYVYNVYFDATVGGGTNADSNLKLVASNQEPSATVTITSEPTSGATAPGNIDPTSGPSAVHPVFIHGEDSCLWVGLQNLEVKVTKPGSILGAVLELKRAVGFKFMGKTIVPDSNRLLRLEVASGF